MNGDVIAVVGLVPIDIGGNVRIIVKVSRRGIALGYLTTYRFYERACLLHAVVAAGGCSGGCIHCFYDCLLKLLSCNSRIIV